MDTGQFEKWHAEGLVSEGSLMKARAYEKTRPFSLFFELRTLLYLGVTLLSGGLGVLVYKNIDSIAHQFIVAFIAIVCLGCVLYCHRKKRAFSPGKTESPNAAFDYVLLLGNVSFITLIGYLQFQYTLFGTAYGLALFIPTVFLLVNAYYFDHLGVLSLAITSLGAWAGIAITPLRLMQENPFSDPRLMYTGLTLGVLLIAAGYAGTKRRFKAHFSFTYNNFAFHLLFVAALTGLFVYENWYPAWFLVCLGIGCYFFWYATKTHSMYFLVFTLLYTYVAMTYVLGRLSLHLQFLEMALVYGGFLYFIGSTAGLVKMLMYFNKKFKTRDRL